MRAINFVSDLFFLSLAWHPFVVLGVLVGIVYAKRRWDARA